MSVGFTYARTCRASLRKFINAIRTQGLRYQVCITKIVINFDCCFAKDFQSFKLLLKVLVSLVMIFGIFNKCGKAVLSSFFGTILTKKGWLKYLNQIFKKASTLSPTLANVYLGQQKTISQKRCPQKFKGKCYKRFVDDIFVLF